jgi:aryl-alcohol dehydrogenase-like predicted oxidoreductase
MKRRLHRIRAATGRHDFTPIPRAVARSLTRTNGLYRSVAVVQTDAEELQRGDFYETLDRLKAQGKIRHYGIACARMQDAVIALSHAGNASVQLAINFLEQAAISEVLPLARTRGIAVIARHPRAIGLLTNGHDDIMGDASAYEDQYGERVRQARELEFLIGPGRSLAQAAIGFVRQLDGVTVTLPRATTVAELEENLGSLSLRPFGGAELERIKSIMT